MLLLILNIVEWVVLLLLLNWLFYIWIFIDCVGFVLDVGFFLKMILVGVFVLWMVNVLLVVNELLNLLVLDDIRGVFRFVCWVKVSELLIVCVIFLWMNWDEFRLFNKFVLVVFVFSGK